MLFFSSQYFYFCLLYLLYYSSYLLIFTSSYFFSSISTSGPSITTLAKLQIQWSLINIWLLLSFSISTFQSSLLLNPSAFFIFVSGIYFKVNWILIGILLVFCSVFAFSWSILNSCSLSRSWTWTLYSLINISSFLILLLLPKSPCYESYSLFLSYLDILREKLLVFIFYLYTL